MWLPVLLLLVCLAPSVIKVTQKVWPKLIQQMLIFERTSRGEERVLLRMGISGQFACGLTTETYLNFFFIELLQIVSTTNRDRVIQSQKHNSLVGLLVAVGLQMLCVGDVAALGPFDQDAVFPAHLIFFGSRRERSVSPGRQPALGWAALWRWLGRVTLHLKELSKGELGGGNQCSGFIWIPREGSGTRRGTAREKNEVVFWFGFLYASFGFLTLSPLHPGLLLRRLENKPPCPGGSGTWGKLVSADTWNWYDLKLENLIVKHFENIYLLGLNVILRPNWRNLGVFLFLCCEILCFILSKTLFYLFHKVSQQLFFGLLFFSLL